MKIVHMVSCSKDSRLFAMNRQFHSSPSVEYHVVQQTTHFYDDELDI